MTDAEKAKLRERFERVVSGPPYERSVARHRCESDVWPGCYIDHDVQLAWDVLCDITEGTK